MRKNHLKTNEIYHVLNKSIAGYEIFNRDDHFSRIIELIKYYNRKKIELKYSRYLKLLKQGTCKKIDSCAESEKLVIVVAYCIMPTHLHLILKQNCENGITNFMSKISNSYTRYFNTKHNRKGPLWVGRFKSVLVENNEQLLHLTRYVHLNPTTSGLIDNPQDWPASSYDEYLWEADSNNKICEFANLLEIIPKKYKKFVESRRSYQRELAKIKKIVID